MTPSATPPILSPSSTLSDEVDTSTKLSSPYLTSVNSRYLDLMLEMRFGGTRTSKYEPSLSNQFLTDDEESLYRRIGYRVQ